MSKLNTVADLVARLQQLDQDLPIGLIDPYKGYDRAISIETVKVDALNEFNWQWNDGIERYKPEIAQRMVEAVVLV